MVPYVARDLAGIARQPKVGSTVSNTSGATGCASNTRRDDDGEL